MPSLPRLPLVPDPLRRIRIAKRLDALIDVGEEVDPRDGGMTSAAVERIWKEVVRLYRSGVHPAIQICVRREGQVVLDRAIGHARGNGPRDPQDAEKVPATTQTPFCVFSTSKGITALVAHLLDERGAIHVGDRVAEYIPEYASHGKETITINHVLAHRAGVPNLPKEALDLDNLADREFLLRMICDAKPVGRPGKWQAYHAVSGGFIIGEVVYRATGKGIREVLAEEILDPLGFRWTNYGVAQEDVPLVGLSYVTGPPLAPPFSTLLSRALGTSPDNVTEMSNDPRYLTAVLPSANTVTTAHELSRFFEIFRRGGELDGIRVMEPRTLRRAVAEQSYLEVDFSLGFPTRFSSGLMLGARFLSLYGPDTEQAFGHLGFTNILAWADPERAVSCGLITTGKPVVYPELPNFYAIMHSISREAKKVDPSERPF